MLQNEWFRLRPLELAFLLFVLCLLFIGRESTKIQNMCYKCASAPIALNWRYYMPSLVGADHSYDKFCTNNVTINNAIGCRGPCMSIKVMGEYKGEDRYFGTMRDCYSNYYRTPKELEFGEECTTKTVIIKSKDYQAEYCYCDGEYCNGPAPPIGTRRQRYYTSAASHTVETELLILCVILINLLR